MKKKISIVLLCAMALAVLTCGCARVDHDADLDVLMPMPQTEGEQGDAKPEVLEEEAAEEGTEPSRTEETEPSHTEEPEPSPMEEEVDSAETEGEPNESADAQQSEYLEYPEVVVGEVILYKREMKVRRPKDYKTVAELLPDLAGEDYIIFYGDVEDYKTRAEYGTPHRIQVLESFYGDVKAGDTIIWQAVGMVVQHCSDVVGLFGTPGGGVPHGESVFILKVVERNGSELTCEAPLAWYSEIKVHEDELKYIEWCINEGSVLPEQLFTLDLIETYLK